MIEETRRNNIELWDRLHREGYDGYSKNSNLSDVTELLPDKYLTNEMRALELGCGRGDYMKRVASLVKEAHGVDISREAVKLAWINLWWISNSYPAVCNGFSLPYPDDYFDFIYEIAVFQHIPRAFTANYLKEVNRCLKHGCLFTAQFISRYGNKENETDIDSPKNEETIGYHLEMIQRMVSVSGLKFITYKKHILKERDNVFWYKILCKKDKKSD